MSAILFKVADPDSGTYLALTRISREIIEAVVLAVVVFMLLQTTVRNFKVEGSSMDPTLEGGQYLLVNRLVYLRIDLERLSRIVPFWQAKEDSLRYALHAPKRGEIVVFEFPQDPTKDFVKRVVGLQVSLIADIVGPSRIRNGGTPSSTVIVMVSMMLCGGEPVSVTTKITLG